MNLYILYNFFFFLIKLMLFFSNCSFKPDTLLIINFFMAKESASINLIPIDAVL